MSGTNNAWGGAYTFTALQSAGGSVQDLMHAYMTTGHGNHGRSVRPLAFDGSAITAAQVLGSTAAKLPPLITLQNAPATVADRQKAYLRANLSQVMQRIGGLPLLPGEVARDTQIGVLSAAWAGIPAGSVVCTRTTDRGTMAFVLNGYHVDPVTGQAGYRAPPSLQNVVSRPAMNQALATTLGATDDTGSTIIESALTLAQFAGFALGPGGLVLSAVAGVLLVIFNKLMSPQQVPLSEIVAAAVQKVEVELQLENADATIGVDYDWFRNHYNSSWADGATVSDADFAQFRSELETKLDADTGIVQTVALLMEPDYQQKGVLLFMLGASLVLLMYKIAVIIESTEKRVVDAYQFQSLMGKLDEYINGGQQAMASIDNAIAQRLGQVVGPNRGTDVRCTPVGTCSGYDYWGWQDTGDPNSQEQKYYDTTTSPDGCHTQNVEHKDQAQTDHDNYCTQLNTQLQQQYYQGQRDKVLASIQNWQAMKTMFSQFAPPSS